MFSICIHSTIGGRVSADEPRDIGGLATMHIRQGDGSITLFAKPSDLPALRKIADGINELSGPDVTPAVEAVIREAHAAINGVTYRDDEAVAEPVI